MRFASDISIWWVLPWAAIAIALSLWFYRDVPWLKELGKKWQIALRALRAAVIFLLGLLLLGLILESVNYREEKPVLISLIDNSSSLLNYKDSSTVRRSINEYRASMKERFGEKYELVEMKVGAFAEYSSSLELNESRSNLAAGFEKIHEDFYNRNVGGIVLVSDGNFNEGSNPVYAAEKISLTPVFSLLVGDTVKKKDHYIKNVAVNDVAFFKNKFPVEVDLEAIKIGRSSVTVKIFRDKQLVASQQVQYEGNQTDFQHVSFLLDADKIGYQTYTVVVNDLENEFNYKNNKRNFYVEIIDSRSKVLFLAGAPHPDVSAIRQELEKDENLEVKAVLARDWDKDLKQVDMIVVHEPGFNMESSLLEKIMESKIPVLFCIGPNAVANTVQGLGIGITIPSGKQTDENQSTINKGFAQFEVSQDLEKAMQYYPPLKTRFGNLKANGAEVLAYQRIGTVQKKDPLIFFVKKNAVKYGVIYGEGVWKWRVNEFARTTEQKGFTELISKISQYLLIKQNSAALRVDMPKRFTKNEEVVVNASFYNESMEPITSPKIDFNLKDEKGKQSKLQFGASGNIYRLSLGKIAPGKYEWNAIAYHNGKKQSKSGVFIVEDIDPELLSNSANSSVLNQLGDASGGKVFNLKKYSDLLNTLEKRGDITTISFKEASFDGLIDFKWIFALLLLFLGLEWFFRRWLGAY